MCNYKKKTEVKKTTTPTFQIGQEVEFIEKPGKPYIVHGIHNTMEAGKVITRFSLVEGSTILDSWFETKVLRLYLPRANFYMYIFPDGSIDDTVRDEEGYSPKGYLLSRFDIAIRLDFTKVELPRLEPQKRPIVEKEDEDEELDEDDF